ncbi:MAG TPA: ATP-binding protein [Candidatus Saccharimonadales bacterium]|nr:ATP-binding protein [Candidatus Saccharimonadales bacterium]
MNQKNVLYTQISDEVIESEVKFRTIAEQSPNMIFINVGGKVAYANKRCEEVTGYSLKEFYSPTFTHLTITAPEYRDLVIKNFRLHAKGKEVKPYEYALITKEGRKLNTILATKLINYGGEKAILGTITDITEKKKAQDALIESEKKYRTLFESMQDGIAIYKVIRNKKREIVDRIVIEANTAYEKMAIVDLSIMKQKTIAQIIGTSRAKESLPQIRLAMQKNISQTIKSQYFIDGKLFDFLSVITPISKDIFIARIIDITSMMDQDRKKDEFIGIASHELKTPLTSLKLYAQILSKNNANLGHYLPKMNEQIEKLDYLVNELLDVSKVQSNNLQLKMEEFSLVDLIKSCVENILFISTQHKINFQYNVDSKISADKGRIEQVIINLLTNAIKYSPNAKKIEIILKATQKDVSIKIKDFGIGIKSSNIDKIFDRFFRAEGSHVHNIPGFGMGLYISKEIIMQHHGKIWVKSKENRGTTFYFRLPIT